MGSREISRFFFSTKTWGLYRLVGVFFVAALCFAMFYTDTCCLSCDAASYITLHVPIVGPSWFKTSSMSKF